MILKGPAAPEIPGHTTVIYGSSINNEINI